MFYGDSPLQVHLCSCCFSVEKFPTLTDHPTLTSARSMGCPRAHTRGLTTWPNRAALDVDPAWHRLETIRSMDEGLGESLTDRLIGG